jgi:hypothetical protein
VPAGNRPPSSRASTRLELWPPAGFEELVHVHRAAHVDIGGDQRHGRVARDVEAPRAHCDPVHAHPRLRQTLYRVVGTAGIGDDAIIGIDGRIRPALRMRSFVQGNRVNGNLHRLSRSPVEAGASALADRREPAERSRLLQLMVTIEEQDVSDLARKGADPQRINRLRAAVSLDFP